MNPAIVKKSFILMTLLVYVAQVFAVSASTDFLVTDASNGSQNAHSSMMLDPSMSDCHDQSDTASSSSMSCCYDESLCDAEYCSVHFSLLGTTIKLEIHSLADYVTFYLTESISFFLSELFRPPQS
ncbi:hypothetical protein [Sessilibacter corallicola]|uniref:hypothetical protein n=1 Tax=Sessilibacter corallicola TaxID=2904075 RepID=UPI001E4EEFCF|nr:hypothetical protein [Sessilibacter corallicola]MCE2029156.1 hypothetical protein [Sessilibacter corallicola]